MLYYILHYFGVDYMYNNHLYVNISNDLYVQ